MATTNEMNNRLTVFFILEDVSNKYGGPVRSVERLRRYLSSSGVNTEIAVAKLGQTSPSPDAIIQEYLSPGQLVSRLIRRKRCGLDTLCVFNNQWTPMVQFLGGVCLLLRIRYVWWVRGVPTFSRWSLKSVVWVLSQKRLLSLSEAIVCSSTKGGTRISQLVPDARGVTLEIPNILENEGKQPLDPGKADKAVKELTLTGDVIKVVTVGRFHRSKRIMEMLSHLPSQVDGKALHVTVAGYCDDRSFLEEIKVLSHELGLETRLVPNASDAEIKSIYRDSDLFVSLSHLENFGLSIGEALMSGLPVVISSETDFWPYFQFRGIFQCSDEELPSAVKKAVLYALGETRDSRKASFEDNWSEYSEQKFLSFLKLCQGLG